MFYYTLKKDNFTSLLTRFEFGSDTPQFKESIFGNNPLIQHISTEKYHFGTKTLLVEKDTGSWVFLDDREMEVYCSVNNMQLKSILKIFPCNNKEDITGFLIKLYWLGLLKMANRRFIVPETFIIGPIVEPKPLFIMHLTDRCNLSCTYCFTDSKPSVKRKMDWQTAKKTINLILRFPSNYATIEFSGGEPLLEFNLLREIVLYVQNQSLRIGKQIRFNIQSNGTLITPEIADFIIKNQIQLSLSLDGNVMINNATRQFCSHKGTYDYILRAMHLLGNGVQNFGVICVITKKNAKEISNILNHFSSLGLVRFKLNPVYKSGRAVKTWTQVSLNADEFLEVHRVYLNYLTENPHPIVDDNTYFMLRNIGQKMHSYRCMRSQCGAGKYFFSINPGGSVFPCDRFRNKESFSLNNVNAIDSFENLFLKNRITKELASRSTENVEKCRDCTFKRFCEAGCTYETYLNSGNINSPHPWCYYYKSIFQSLFSTISTDNKIIEKFEIDANVFNKSWFS